MCGFKSAMKDASKLQGIKRCNIQETRRKVQEKHSMAFVTFCTSQVTQVIQVEEVEIYAHAFHRHGSVDNAPAFHRHGSVFSN